MGGNSYDTYGEGSASSYWRRRFIVLAIGLVVFGLAAWGLSSALAVKSVPASRAGRIGADQPTETGPRSGSNAPDTQRSGSSSPHSARSGNGRADSRGSGSQNGQPADGHPGAGRPGAGRSGAGQSGAGQSGTGQAGAGRSDGGRSDNSPRSGVGQSGGGQFGGGPSDASGGQSDPGASSGGRPQSGNSGSGQAAGNGTILPAFCGRSDIVLSIFAGQTHFGPKDSATFELSIVSTQPTECTFNIGSAHLALVIKEGPTRVWSSADCAVGTPSLDAALGRGVPTVVTITWHRSTSAPGCSGRSMRVPAGAYTAYAIDGTLTSQPISFRLT